MERTNSDDRNEYTGAKSDLKDLSGNEKLIETDLDNKREDSLNALIASFPDNRRMIEAAISHFEEAISMLDKSRTKSYHRALSLSPDLVKSESDPLLFLKRESMNPFTAAKRLALYWEYREEVFRERAFLPIQDRTGMGALSEEDLALFHGALQELPCDSDGCPVLFLNQLRLEGSAINDNRHRLLFYRFHQASTKSEKAQTEGVVLINLLHFSFEQSVIPKSHIELSQMWLEKAFPTNIKKIHIICLADGLVSPQFKESVAAVVKKRAGKYFAKYIDVHCGNTDQISEILISNGFRKDGLPSCLGGTFVDPNYEGTDVNPIIEKNEKNMLIVSALAEYQASRDSCQQTSPGTTPLAKRKTPSLENQEKIEEERRRKDAINSRKKRERQKMRYQLLLQDAEEVASENASLKKEGERLEKLLNDAKAVVEHHMKHSSLSTNNSIPLINPALFPGFQGHSLGLNAYAPIPRQQPQFYGYPFTSLRDAPPDPLRDFRRFLPPS